MCVQRHQYADTENQDGKQHAQPVETESQVDAVSR